jgi:ribosomal protein S12 methylthiotransferase accessory factor
MSSEMLVTFPGGKKIATAVGTHAILTDQPVAKGGEDSAPTPFQLFLAAIGTCAGIYVVGFCQKRGLPTEGIRIRQRNHVDPETGTLVRAELDIELPPSFPEKYRDALVRVADQCLVKKTIEAQPAFEVRAVVAGA